MSDIFASGEQRTRRTGRAHRIGIHLAALALACALPLVALSIYTIFSFAHMEHEVTRDDILGTARAAAVMVDVQLGNWQGDLEALSAFYNPNRLASFYENTKVVVAGEDPCVKISLLDPAGNVAFDTDHPLDDETIHWDDPVGFAQALSSGKPFISDLFRRTGDRMPMVAVYAPVIVDTHVEGVLAMSIPTTQLSHLLADQRMPAGWMMGMADRERFIIARSVTPKGYVGRQVPANLARPTEAQKELFVASPGIGQGPQYIAMARSDLSSWVVALGIPQAIVDAPLHRALRNFTIIGLCVLVFGMACAALIGRNLSGATRGLAQAALGLIEHRPMPAIDSKVREIRDVGEALAIASERLRENDQQLRRAQKHLSRAQAVAHVGSFEHDLRTDKSIWSSEMFAILGEPSDLVPSPDMFLSRVAEADRPRLQAAMAGVRGGREPDALDVTICCRDGAARIVHIGAKLVYDDDDDGSLGGAARDDVAGKVVIGVIGTVHDITDRVRLEAERQELQTRLHQSQKLEALGTLAGGVAHDLNNTLVPIIALTKLARKTMPEGSRALQDLETVIAAAAQARDLVKQILTFSRQESGEKGRIDLSIMLCDALKMFRATIPPAIELSADIVDGGYVWAEPSQLHQVIFNFMTNAVQAIGDGPGRIAVTLARRPDRTGGNDVLHFTVTDTGCGMDEATQRRVFEPFFTTKGVGEGTGLGLSVAHGIVTAIGGTIAIASAVGKGTTFEVVVPALDVAA